MASSSSTELDLKRTSFVLSPEERALGSTLENDLHPMYQRFNFRAGHFRDSSLINKTGLNLFRRWRRIFTSVEEDAEPFLAGRVYERMVPAFRLASLLLEFSLPFFAKVFCADILSISQQYTLDPTYQCTDADIQRVRDLLVEWSERTRFYCKTEFGPHTTEQPFTEAATEVRTGGRPLPTPARTHISINVRTFEFFAQKSYDEIDAETKTSQIIQLAFVLVHEQAHAVFNHRWAEDPELSEADRDRFARADPSEPMYHAHMDPRYNELGYALQAWIHGGSVIGDGAKLIFVEYPGDVLGEAKIARRYPFRANLLSREFWQAVQKADRPPAYWHGDNFPAGWLGQALEGWRLTRSE